MTAEPSWLSFTVGSSIRNCLRLLRLPLRALTLGEVHSRARGTDTNLKKNKKTIDVKGAFCHTPLYVKHLAHTKLDLLYLP